MKRLSVLMVGCALALASPAVAQQFDLVILNGRVLDPETGLDAPRSIGIRGDKIAAVEPGPLQGRRSIDARGLVVAPGFIDLHRHGQDDENYRYAALDGVTTALELEVGVGDVAQWYREREPGRLVHYGAAIGHIPVRMAVLGDSGAFLPSGPAADQEATEEQIREMASRIDEGLRQGAVGVGFGTAYTPAASRWEVLEMFRTAAPHRAPAYIHVRNGVVGVQEAIADAVVTGTPLHIVHLNSTSGDDIHRMLRLLAEAQGRGLDVTTEAYPYTAGATRIESALYDGWEQRPDEWFHAFEWPETGERLTRESFARYRQIGGTVIRHGNSEENVSAAIASPLTMIASDGGLRGGKGHPRSTGSYSKVLGRYVREAGALSLMDAIHQMTLMPARRLEGRIPEMRDKGRIRVGADADLVLFDAERVIDRSSYQEPALAPEGIRHVLVAGVPVVTGGRIVQGVAPGRAVRAPGTAGGETPPDPAPSLRTAGFAKVLCSAVFVSGRDPGEAVRNVDKFDLPAPERTITDTVIDYERREVRLTYKGTLTRTARHYGDQGCVIHPEGFDRVFFEPVPVVSSLPDAATQDWPMGDRLPDAPLPEGVDAARLAAAVDSAFADPEALTAGFVVVHDGRIIAERYGAGAHKDMQLESWSMGKSLTATLFGRLVQDGHFRLDEPAPVREWRDRPGDPRARIRNRDLLQMSSGLHFVAPRDPDYSPALGYPDHMYIYTGAVDAFEHSITRPLQFQPGTEGRYRNSDPLTLGHLIREAVEARGESYHTFPQRELFDRIGIRRQVLETDPYGNFLLTGYDYGTPRNWARLGLLYLQDGVWMGERLLPEGWSEFVSTPAPAWDEPVYGGQFWINGTGEWNLPRDAYYMAGAGGQYTFVVPSHDLVVVRMGHFRGSRAGARSLNAALAELIRAVPAAAPAR